MLLLLERGVGQLFVLIVRQRRAVAIDHVLSSLHTFGGRTRVRVRVVGRWHWGSFRFELSRDIPHPREWSLSALAWMSGVASWSRQRSRRISGTIVFPLILVLLKIIYVLVVV